MYLLIINHLTFLPTTFQYLLHPPLKEVQSQAYHPETPNPSLIKQTIKVAIAVVVTLLAFMVSNITAMAGHIISAGFLQVVRQLVSA